jgi:hypothetical protein
VVARAREAARRDAACRGWAPSGMACSPAPAHLASRHRGRHAPHHRSRAAPVGQPPGGGHQLGARGAAVQRAADAQTAWAEGRRAARGAATGSGCGARDCKRCAAAAGAARGATSWGPGAAEALGAQHEGTGCVGRPSGRRARVLVRRGALHEAGAARRGCARRSRKSTRSAGGLSDPPVASMEPTWMPRSCGCAHAHAHAHAHTHTVSGTHATTHGPTRPHTTPPHAPSPGHPPRPPAGSTLTHRRAQHRQV